MLQPLFNRPRTPFEVFFFLFCLAIAFVFRRNIQQAFGRTRILVLNHILNRQAQFVGNIVVNRHLPRVHNPHIHARLDGMVEEHAVNRFAHRIIAPERERYVGNPAGNVRVRQVLANPARGFDKVHRVIIVFVDPRGYREDVRVENNVFGREADLFRQNFVSAGADFDFPRLGIRLPLFVERHHHHRSPVTAHQLGLMDEFFHAFLHRNRVDDAFALDALQPCLDDFPLGGIDHDRHAGNVRFRGDQVEEAGHFFFRIQQAFVHIDVDDGSAAFDLLQRHR